MTHLRPIVAVFSLVALTVIALRQGTQPLPIALPPGTAHVATFVPNVGQWQHTALYEARFPSGAVFLESDGWTVALARDGRGAAFRMRFADARAADLVPGDRRGGTNSYFVGQSPECWRTGVARYGSVRYRRLLAGIDVQVESRNGWFEYDLELSPEADAAAIVVEVEGTRSLSVDSRGDLWIDTGLGSVRQPRPTTYEVDAAGARWPVACSYDLRSSTSFGFVVPRRDATRRLVIDPGLEWSTFVGGSVEDFAYDMIVSTSGIVTFVGSTISSSYPVSLGTYDATPNGFYDAVVTRMNPLLPAANQLLYSTYLGGTGTDVARAVAIDASGVITVVGDTSSADFPTTAGALDVTYNGSNDVFVARLDLGLTGPQQLVYSTYVGGSNVDYAFDVVASPSGFLTIAGATLSTDWPTTLGAWDAANESALWDGFVARLHPSLPPALQLRYSTFLGGSGSDSAEAVYVEGSGRITLVGSSTSSNYPTTPGAWDTSHNGDRDIVVSTLDPLLPSAQQLTYSTVLGGSSGEGATCIAVDRDGVITFAGLTMSTDYPTTSGAWDRTFNGGLGGMPKDAFLARIDPSRPASQQLVYSTYIGGSSDEIALDVAVDSAGTATIAGWTGSNNFPTTAGAADETYNGGRGGASAPPQDVFVTRIDPSLPAVQQILYSSVLGGSGDESATCIGLDSSLSALLAGTTSSDNYPTTSGAWDTTYNGGTTLGGDAFVTKLDLMPTGARRVGRSSPGCTGPLGAWVTSMPCIGNASFAMACSDAPPLAAGVLAWALTSLQTPVQAAGIDVWIDPATLFWPAGVTSDARGTCAFAMPIPGDTGLVGLGLAGQWIWAGPTTPPCPRLGLSASSAIELRIQP